MDTIKLQRGREPGEIDHEKIKRSGSLDERLVSSAYLALSDSDLIRQLRVNSLRTKNDREAKKYFLVKISRLQEDTPLSTVF